MFAHILTMKSPDKWEYIRKEAEKRLKEDLSEFKPMFVHWNDIKLDVSNPVDQVTNAALWDRVCPILLFGRRDKIILVIQVTAENLDEINAINDNSDSLSFEAHNMKRAVVMNSIQYFT